MQVLNPVTEQGSLAPVDFAVHSLDGSVEARRFQVRSETTEWLG